jgi:hypothetical protein
MSGSMVALACLVLAFVIQIVPSANVSLKRQPPASKRIVNVSRAGRQEPQ